MVIEYVPRYVTNNGAVGLFSDIITGKIDRTIGQYEPSRLDGVPRTIGTAEDLDQFISSAPESYDEDRHCSQPFSVNDLGRLQWTCLNVAIDHGRMDCVAWMLERGARVDGFQAQRKSAIWQAVDSNQDEVCQYFLQQSPSLAVKVFQRTPGSMSPLGVVEIRNRAKDYDLLHEQVGITEASESIQNAMIKVGYFDMMTPRACVREVCKLPLDQKRQVLGDDLLNAVSDGKLMAHANSLFRSECGRSRPLIQLALLNDRLAHLLENQQYTTSELVRGCLFTEKETQLLKVAAQVAQSYFYMLDLIQKYGRQAPKVVVACDTQPCTEDHQVSGDIHSKVRVTCKVDQQPFTPLLEELKHRIVSYALCEHPDMLVSAFGWFSQKNQSAEMMDVLLPGAAV